MSNVSVKDYFSPFRCEATECSPRRLPLLLHAQELQVVRVQQGLLAQQGFRLHRLAPAQARCADPHPLRHGRLPRRGAVGHLTAPAGVPASGQYIF